MKNTKKTWFIVVTACAAALVGGGLLLVPYSALWGYLFSGLSVIVYAVFLIAYKKNKEALVKLSIVLYVTGIFICAAMIGLAYSGLFGMLGGLTDAELREYLERSSVPRLLFILLQFLQVTFIPIPSAVSTVAGALAFGWESLFLTLIGVFIGSFLAFGFGRWFGEKVVVWIVGSETLDKYHKYAKGKDKTLLFLMFLLPFFPDDALCILSGFTDMKFRTFVLMMCVSRPIQAAATIFVTLVLNNNIPNELKLTGYIVGGALIAALFILVLKYNKQIETLMLKLSEKLSRIKDKTVRKIKSTAAYKKFDEKTFAQREKIKNARLYKKYAEKVKKNKGTEDAKADVNAGSESAGINDREKVLKSVDRDK
ncbi:MAG: VTT domain-containing protein [Clostridiales bacterium]|jgi:uncharacterized membrane protein YdjX (TVP38/TMEM64 family)|nr:VTT domain-containing protein [Clostridiales bacterium]